MITILTWISIITGGLLVLLLLLSIIGGLDFDLDVEIGSTEVDSGSGGLGLLKGFLTFASVSSWVMKIALMGKQSTALVICIGVISGLLAFSLLNWLLKMLLRNEENVNWTISDALYQRGTTYLKVPEKGEGIVQINIKGAIRELKAKTKSGEVPTGTPVMVIDLEGEHVIVEPYVD